MNPPETELLASLPLTSPLYDRLVAGGLEPVAAARLALELGPVLAAVESDMPADELAKLAADYSLATMKEYNDLAEHARLTRMADEAVLDLLAASPRPNRAQRRARQKKRGKGYTR